MTAADALVNVARLRFWKIDWRLQAFEGRLIGQTTGNNLDETTNFIPRMNRETLREGYKSLMGYLYAPLFPLAVTLSIYGHHFRKTCRVLGL